MTMQQSAPRAIPKARYTSERWMQLEQERLWPKVWLPAAHVSQFAKAGDFVVFDHGALSVLLLRDATGAVHAWANSCPHRGARLCSSPRGTLSTVRCGYHGWEWALDGSLSHAPGGNDIVAAATAAGLALSSVRCESRLGVLWVTTAAPESIDDFLTPLAPLMTPYRPEKMALRASTTVELPCNWKTSSDVSNESYHLRTLHPEILPVLDPAQVRTRAEGRHGHIVIPLGAGRHKPGSAPVATQVGMLQRAGVSAESMPQTQEGVVPALRAAVRESAAKAGLDLSLLDDAQLSEKHQFFTFPNTQLNFTATTLEVYRHRPHPTDPERMFFDQLFLEHLAEGQSAPVCEPRTVELGSTSLGAVMDQDLAFIPELQLGLRTQVARTFWCGGEEAAIAHMHDELERYLGVGPDIGGDE